MKTGFVLVVCVFAVFTLGVGPGDPMAVYKTGDYQTALPLLRTAAKDKPNDPGIAAALLSTLVYQGQVDEAADLADADATAFPNSPEVVAARGEFAFYMSDMPQAETLFKAAVKMNDSTPRAVYGLYRLFRMASMYRTARLLCLKAHELDPDDARITKDWLRYLLPEKRREVLGPFLAAHPWFYKNIERSREETATEVQTELNNRKAFQLVGPRQETDVNLTDIRDMPRYARGVGIEIAIQGRRRILTLFDMGASGILIKQAAADKAGLEHIGSFQVGGIGDTGMRKAFAAVSEDCTIGSMKFTTCIFGVVEGKTPIAGEDDGLIGADFFSDYILHIDFQKHRLHLVPLPDRPPNPQGYDRTISPDEAGFTPVFRSGGHLFVSTKVNGKTSGLFLLDTGASFSNIDSTFARLSTKIHGNSWIRVKGVSGDVKNVFEADKAELQFGRFRQSNLGLTALDLNNSPEHQEFRMAGTLGIPILSMFRLTVDYRNGLVDFDYILEKRR